MIGKYEGPRTDAGQFYAAPRARHRATTQLGPTILRSAALPLRTRARLFLVALLWHARRAVVRAIVEAPAVVSDWRHAHRWTTWREDLLIAAFGVGVTAIVVPLVIWALEAWLR